MKGIIGRLLFLLGDGLKLVGAFVVAKVAFMYAQSGTHPFAGSDVWHVVCHGLSLDLSTALYFLIVPFLVVIASVWWKRHDLLRKGLNGYYLLVALVLSLAFVADTSLYPFWGFKLDASCLQFLSTPGDAFASVSVGYVVGRVALIVVVAAALAFLLTRRRWPFAVRCRRWLATVLIVMLAPLMVIGIRGGVDESTTNIGQVYFSQNQFLNHAAINPVFSFLASMEKTASDQTDYHYMDDRACDQLTASLFPTTSIDTDTLLTTQRPDIIVILLESAGGAFTELGGRTDIMPHLNRLMHEGISFDRCYANSWRTDRGTLCTWSGYPSFPTTSVMKMPAKSRNLPNLAATLARQGYHTHYLYGGDINFTNMRSYLVSGGFSQLTWKADYSREQQQSANWGVRDDLTFDTLLQLADTLPRPYLIGYSTLSSHEPWDVPTHQFEDKVINAFHYLDECIGRFMARLRQSPRWKNTLVVMIPDHGINYGDIDETHPVRNHIPMVWVGGAVKAPRRISTICNQTDLAATLLAQLGLDHSAFTFSRDVLSRSYRYPFAYHTYNNGFSLVDSTGMVVYDLNSGRVIAGDSGDKERLVRMGKALLQRSSDDLKKR